MPAMAGMLQAPLEMLALAVAARAAASVPTQAVGSEGSRQPLGHALAMLAMRVKACEWRDVRRMADLEEECCAAALAGAP